MRNVKVGTWQNDAKEKELFLITVEYDSSEEALYAEAKYQLISYSTVIKNSRFLLRRFAVFLPSHFSFATLRCKYLR